MEIAATRGSHISRVVWDSRKLTTNKNLGYETFPSDLVQLRPTVLVGALVLRGVGFVFETALRLLYKPFRHFKTCFGLVPSSFSPKIGCCIDQKGSDCLWRGERSLFP